MVITLLVRTLTLQMELEPGDAMWCLDEMVVVFREQFSSNLSGPVLRSAVESFGQAVSTLMDYSWDPPSQQIIHCLCEANVRLPDSYNVSIALPTYFYLRSMLT